MTARKIKHQRALEKREQFMLTVKEGNLDVLNKVRNQREEDKKRLEKEAKDKKIEKSKKLAAQHGKAAKGVQTHKRAPKGAFKSLKKENN